jgi:hypothetical protein
MQPGDTKGDTNAKGSAVFQDIAVIRHVPNLSATGKRRDRPRRALLRRSGRFER